MYRTTAATKTVRMRPGTRPRMWYDQRKDMIARQIYSEKSNAAVYLRISRRLNFSRLEEKSWRVV